MDATLNLYTKLLAFSDKTVNSNPRLRAVDWERESSGIAVRDPDSKGHEIAPGASQIIFDGTRTTSIDGTSAFSLKLLTGTTSTYRITNTAGTAPSFRVGRNLTLDSCVVTFAVGSNNLVTLSVSGLSPSNFVNVQAGDIIFVPHVTTGDPANVISTLNSGYWQVLAKTSSLILSLSRLAGDVFEGTSETVALTADTQMVAFGTSGVQIGDSVAISYGFSFSAQKTFTVTNVTDSFFEFMSSLPLPDETGIIPGVSGLSFYTDNKKLLYVEADQECVVRVNGDTSSTQIVSPIEPGNPNLPGIYLKWGSVFSLVVLNKSTSTLNLLIITAK